MKKPLAIGCCVFVASCTTVQQHNDSAIAAATVDGDVQKSMTCNLCVDFRRLVIVTRPGGRCEVYYAKNGEAEKIAEGSDPAECQTVYERRGIDLADSGFHCR